MAGFCKSADLEEIQSHDFALTPGRYVGAEEVEDDGEEHDHDGLASGATPAKAMSHVNDDNDAEEEQVEEEACDGEGDRGLGREEL